MADYPFDIESELILISVRLFGKQNYIHNCEFILDTGASRTMIDHSLAFDLGYSARDGIGISKVSSVVGKEKGYLLQIEGIEALGQKFGPFQVACHDLKNQGVEGLLGMTFLKQFGWCIDPKKQIISVK